VATYVHKQREEALVSETEILRRNVLAEIAKRFIPRPEDREHFMATGETAVWDKQQGRYRQFIPEVSDFKDMYALDAWLDVKKAMEYKTPRGRHAAIVRLAKKWKVSGFN
jgi:hypothetical protein